MNTYLLVAIVTGMVLLALCLAYPIAVYLEKKYVAWGDRLVDEYADFAHHAYLINYHSPHANVEDKAELDAMVRQWNRRERLWSICRWFFQK